MGFLRVLATTLALAFLAASPARAANKPWDFKVAPPTSVAPMPSGGKPRSVSLVRAFVDMGDGVDWASVYYCCMTIGRGTVAWQGSRSDIDVKDLAHDFDSVLGQAGFSEGPTTKLFASGEGGELQIGAVLRNLGAYLCSGCGLTTTTDRFNGRARMDVEWQLYSPLERKVLLTVKTSGTFETEKSLEGVGHILTGAFQENVRKLLNDPGFRELIASPPAAITPVNSQAFAPILLPAAGSERRPIAEAMNSVAVVFANTGMGSGFVVSAGYLLTNQHVLGDAKFVKLKWADGSESLGEVIRSDRRRDVGLVKFEAGRHPPLSLRGQAASPGETVFAVGTPLDERYQNTLTKGIVSGSRMIEGLPYLQSDVAIDHGNSGGPLLDEQGRVIAVAVMRDERDGVGHDISFFVPISEALAALSLKVQTP